MSLHLIEFVSVQRHILQVEADDKDDVLEAAEDIAHDGHCPGMAIYDTEKPVLLHGPYGSETFDLLEEGQPLWFQQPFSDDPQWLRDAAAQLLKLADEREATT